MISIVEITALLLRCWYKQKVKKLKQVKKGKQEKNLGLMDKTVRNAEMHKVEQMKIKLNTRDERTE